MTRRAAERPLKIDPKVPNRRYRRGLQTGDWRNHENIVNINIDLIWLPEGLNWPTVGGGGLSTLMASLTVKYPLFLHLPLNIGCTGHSTLLTSFVYHVQYLLSDWTLSPVERDLSLIVIFNIAIASLSYSIARFRDYFSNIKWVIHPKCNSVCGFWFSTVSHWHNCSNSA